MKNFLDRFTWTEQDGEGLPMGLVGLRRQTPDSDSRQEVWFRLAASYNYEFHISASDSNGNELSKLPDYHDFTGATSMLLRALTQAQASDFSRIDWESEADDDKPKVPRVELRNHPELAGMLASAGHVINEKGEPIRFSDSPARLIYSIHSFDTEKDLYYPLFYIESEDKPVTAYAQLITDSYVLCDKTIYPIPSVGDNYTSIHLFLSPFPKSDIDMALSMFMTCFTGIDVRVTDKDVAVSGIAESYQPTIIFERIDAEKALYLRIASTNSKLPQSHARLGLTMIVKHDEESNTFSAHPILPLDITPYMEQVKETVRKTAPSRKTANEVYEDDEEGLLILPPEVAGNFLFHGLPTLLGQFRILGTDKLKEYNVRAVMPKLKVSLSSGIDFLSGSAEVAVGDEHMTLADFINRYSAKHYITLSDGTRAIFDSDYMKRLERIYKHNRGKGKDGEFKISFFDLPEVEAMLEERIAGEVVGRTRKLYEGFRKLPERKLSVPKLKATLRPYQEEGVKWINYLYDNRIGGCLADDMGLGKTIQTISMLLKIYPKADKPTLIVMPRSLLFNWERELDKFAPSLKYHIYYGPDRNMDEALKSQIILTTYALVRNDVEKFQNIDFEYIVLDESQNIKNTDAQVTHAVWLLRGEHRLAISGTPIENNLTELYSLFRFLNPTMFGSLDDFNKLYTYPIQSQHDELASEDLRRKVYPFILRRIKKDVLPDLPDLIEQTLDVEMEPSHAEFYERRRAEYYRQIHEQIQREGFNKSQFLMLQALTELRRIVSVPESLSDGRIKSSKLPMLIDQIADLASNGHKTVVFFNFIAGIELVGEHLDRLGIGYATMTGATTDRKKVVDRFVTEPDCKVMLMTLKTGGVGLNLTVADTVIIFEPWWNRAAELQAINRLHRIGQSAKVMSYSMITHNTIEERIRELQEQKSLLVDEIISSDSGAFKHLTEEDIDFILSK